MESKNKTSIFSRRGLLTGAVLGSGFLYLSRGAAQSSSDIQVAALDGGLEVRDYRIFPTQDARRFIVEVHNTTDEMIDTPTLGVVLNHLQETDDFSVASPSSAVLHPHTSGVLFGIAPDGLLCDDDWGTPRWILCNKLSTERSRQLATLNLELTYGMEVFDEGNAEALANVVNLGHEEAQGYALGGTLFDSEGRTCGIVVTSNGWRIPVGEARFYKYPISTSADYFGSPFVLVDSAHDLSLEMSIQPHLTFEAPSCAAIMPWNRE